MPKLTRAQRSRLNKERWSKGDRWTPTPDGDGHVPSNSVVNGNGKSEATSDPPPELSKSETVSDSPPHATPAKRSNKWQSAPTGAAGDASAPELVYGLSATRAGSAPAYSARARLLAAAQADTPSEAGRLAAPFAPPCRCCRPLPEARNGYLWLGYRFAMCCKCGHDVL